MRRSFALALSIGLPVTMLLSACGGSAKPASTPPAGQGQSQATPTNYMTTQDQTALVAEAKKEGQVSWDTSLAGPVVQALAQGFQQKYGIKVTVDRAAENVLDTSILQADKAGQTTADVAEVPIGSVLTLQAAGVLTPYYSPSTQTIPSAFKIPASGGTVWGASDRVSYIAYAFNSKVLPADQAPKQLSDLLKPVFKGKLAVATSTTGIRWLGGVMHLLGQTAGQQFFSQFGKQQVKAESVSGAALMGLIASGQIGGSPDIFHEHEQEQAQKGAPVQWIPMQPVVANVGDIIVLKKAPNPAAATLFADYLLGSDSDQIYSQNLYIRPATPVSFQYWVPESGVTAAQYNQEFTQWKTLFNSTFVGH